ncbi:cytochrome c peroxidase [Methylobacterium sp. Leaf100]|uniref:cytochrome-c peroxidase n=1 Tax=Methylobacterium sp. Leaf100 TaxID=1736252 RepID=UPI0007001E12|nr:cytochrome c peroxidase [Methylobacterium sp. Leaf100]KQP17382.1 tryptophan tryptophylquinone biosynthesis enzyme MauG [Methylobacterium sp. Leaf100]
MRWKVGGACAVAALAAYMVNQATGTIPVPAQAVAAPADARAAFQTREAVVFPAFNPYSPEKAALGQRLFFDPMLSGAGSMSCASCHDPQKAWGENRPRGIGEVGMPMKLRTPTLLHVATAPILGWDGKFRSLENVTFTPISSPVVMNLPESVLIQRLRGDAGYVQDFAAAFPNGAITRTTIEQALATYQRTIQPGLSAFDRWIAGDARAISLRAQDGFRLFTGKARCAECHSGSAFTDASFHDIGVGQGEDIGRGAFFPSSRMLRYAFKTPTLRDVAIRAPYMHDGSVATLEAVIDLYDRGGIDRPSRAADVRPLNLTASEKADLLAFLKTLTSTGPAPKFEPSPRN